MEYPHIPQHFSKDELFEHFTLTQDERYNLPQWRKEQNILGFAVLLKTYSFLGFPPRRKKDVPVSVVSWISQQLDVDPAGYERYLWKSRLWDIHLASIRDYTGFRPGNREDFQKLANWLIEEARRHPSRSKMYAAAIHRCRHLRLELPREKELQRLVNSAWQQYLSIVCRKISESLGSKIRIKMDQCLDFDPDHKSCLKLSDGRCRLGSQVPEQKTYVLSRNRGGSQRPVQRHTGRNMGPKERKRHTSHEALF